MFIIENCVYEGIESKYVKKNRSMQHAKKAVSVKKASHKRLGKIHPK